VDVGVGAAAWYLLCSISAVASLFGPSALQAFMFGQVALTAIASMIWLIGIAISFSSDTGVPPFTEARHQRPEESSALESFAISARLPVPWHMACIRF
jgi:hypothetical protein